MYEEDFNIVLLNDLAASAGKMLFEVDYGSTPVSLCSIKDADTRKEAEALLEMVDQGQIQEAEDKMFNITNVRTADNMMVGFVYYAYLTGKDNDWLAKYSYSPQKIKERIRYFAERYGIEEMVDLFFYE